MRAPSIAAIAALAFVLANAAFAVTPDEMLADPVLEARARNISRELRCVVCQNQSIDDSNAPLARDMRIIVRERIVAGDSDAAVKAFLVSRYGDFVLLRPPMRGDTLILWLGPLFMLVATAGGFAFYLKRRRDAARIDEGGALLEAEAMKLAEIRKQLAP